MKVLGEMQKDIAAEINNEELSENISAALAVIYNSLELLTEFDVSQEAGRIAIRILSDSAFDQLGRDNKPQMVKELDLCKRLTAIGIINTTRQLEAEAKQKASLAAVLDILTKAGVEVPEPAKAQIH